MKKVWNRTEASVPARFLAGTFSSGMPHWFCLFLGLLLLVPVDRVSAKPPRQTEVVVIGAGLSGLAAAYELKKAHVPYHILEIAPRVGGRVRTVRYQRPGQPEIYADSGMEEYWQSNPAVQILKELRLPYSSDVAVSTIVLQNHVYPLGKETPADFKKTLFSKDELESLNAFNAKVAPWIHELQSGSPENPLTPKGERGVPPQIIKLMDISLADFVRQEKVASKVADWIRISLECEIATAWDRISALDGIAEYHIFLGDGEECYRVTGGNDKFTQAMAKFVGTGNISLNHRVTRVVSGPNGVEVHFLHTEPNENGVVGGRYVISTIPLFRLFEVQFVPPLSDKKQEAIQSMAWGSYFKAHIFLPAKAARFWTKGDSTILPILSDSELGVIYDGNPQQEQPTKILSLLVHGDSAEAFNLMPLDAVRKRIVTGLDKLWPGIAREIQDMEFYRFHPRAIAAWPVGRSRFDEFSNEIRRPENNVYLAGDFTESSHSDGAFISAHRVVQAILGSRHAKDRRALPR